MSSWFNKVVAANHDVSVMLIQDGDHWTVLANGMVAAVAADKTQAIAARDMIRDKAKAEKRKAR